MKLLIALTLLAGIAWSTSDLALAADGTTKNIYRVLKFGPANVGIYCTNGAAPVASMNGHILEVSCSQ